MLPPPQTPQSPAAAGAASPQAWLDVPQLLEQSLPRGGAGRYLVLLLPLGLVGLLLAILLMLLAPGRSVWLPIAALVALGVSAGMLVALSQIAKAARRERRQIGEIEELINLRHFPPAAERLAGLLGRSMRLAQHRAMALVQLVRILARYERFDDAVSVADEVLAGPLVDPGTKFSLGCARAMALLRAGRLFDAGEAITGLRRQVSRLDEALRRLQAQPAEGDQPTFPTDEEEETDPAPRQPFDSAALTLVELYRDIQTRHSAEALATVEQKRTALRDAMGVRLGDALALGALAAHRLAEGPKSGGLWRDATCLMPEAELLRRYPELSEVSQVHAATPRPAEGREG